MVGQVLVDADVVIDFLNGREPQAKVLEGLLIERRAVLSAVTVFELCAGVTGKGRISAIDKLVRAVVILHLGEEEARMAASIYTDLRNTGQLIGNSDLLIAATAIVKKTPLYTRNLSHFERVQGLSLWRPAP